MPLQNLWNGWLFIPEVHVYVDVWMPCFFYVRRQWKQVTTLLQEHAFFTGEGRKEKAMLSRTPGYDSQEADVAVPGFVLSNSESIVYSLKWRTGKQDFYFVPLLICSKSCIELQNHLTFSVSHL